MCCLKTRFSFLLLIFLTLNSVSLSVLKVNLNKLQEDGESSKDVRGDEKPHNTKRRLRSHSE